jgi:hypothetical protein
MKHQHRSWILTGAIVIAIVGWVKIETFTNESTAPSTRTAAPLAATPPAAVIPTERELGAPGQALIESSRPVLATIYGRTVNTDGLDVESFLTKVAPTARRGDAMAAYRVYQAEAMCAALDPLTRMDVSQADAETRTTHVAYVAQMTEACAGVTPAQIEERFGFLDQAVRAGNEQAMIDYRVEGPNGRDIATFDPRDPLLTAWKKDSNAYLQQLAAKGDQDAWSLLAQDYENGIVVDRDLGAAITYWTALQISRKPDADPLSIDFIGDMAKQLTEAEVQQAIAQGRMLGTQFPRKRRSV